MPRWEILCGIGILFWGFWCWGLRVALERDRNFLAVTVTTSLGILGVALLTYWVFSTKQPLAVTASILGLMLFTGITGGAGQVYLSKALEVGPVSVVVPMYAMAPMITVILSVVFLHDGFTARQGIGVLLAFASSIILALEEKRNEQTAAGSEDA